MMSQDKRYVVTMDMYVYAKDDYTARKKAHKMKDAFDKYNRRPAITEIGEQPFAQLTYRKLSDHSEPFEDSKTEDLPF
jgi:hypothetical protein